VYPIALDLRGRLALVVGGGAVAERKVRGLLAAGAVVRVVTPVASPALAELAAAGALELRARPYAAGDLAGARLVYTATDRPDVNATVVADARAAAILVDDAAGGEATDFTTPLAHRVGALTFAVDTGGSSPSFARRLLRELGERFDGRYGTAAENLGRARSYAKAVVPAADRAGVMGDLAERPIDELAAMDASRVEHAVEEAQAALRPAPGARPVPTLVCATRASALAMWQTRHVGGRLARVGIASTIMQISTKGDRVVDRSLAALGTDSIFVKELELALRDGRADYAVHSCKDLPSELPEDMTLAAIGPREDPRDAFCSENYASFDALPPGALVGTSSPRRRAQLQAARPDLRFAVVRGNVDTRLRKLRDGEYDAIVLAMAGLTRLGIGATHTVPLDPTLVVPAVGQGALAIEVRASNPELAERLHAALADHGTELAVRSERAFLRTLRGGCQAPVGAYAICSHETIALSAVIAAPDGSRLVRGHAVRVPSDPTTPEDLGRKLAERLLAEGGDAILGAAVTNETTSPLGGMLCLLPRTQDRPSKIAPAFREIGAEVVEAADAEAVEAVLGARVPGLLLFPSSGSVAAIAPYLARLLTVAGDRPAVAAMGEASAAAASAAGFTPDAIATEPTVEALIASVTAYLATTGR